MVSEIVMAAGPTLADKVLGAGRVLLLTLALGTLLASIAYSDIRGRRFRARSVLAPEPAEVLEAGRRDMRVLIYGLPFLFLVCILLAALLKAS